MELTQEYLKNRLHYNLETGVFTWLNGQCKGRVAGSKSTRGYLKIRLNKKSYFLHRLAFLYVEGSIPKVVDHINKLTNDNSWVNLRRSDNFSNQVNTDVSKNNKEGIKGLCWDKHNNNWKGQVKYNGKIRTKSHKNKQLVLEWLKEHQAIQESLSHQSL